MSSDLEFLNEYRAFLDIPVLSPIPESPKQLSPKRDFEQLSPKKDFKQPEYQKQIREPLEDITDKFPPTVNYSEPKRAPPYARRGQCSSYKVRRDYGKRDLHKVVSPVRDFHKAVPPVKPNLLKPVIDLRYELADFSSMYEEMIEDEADRRRRSRRVSRAKLYDMVDPTNRDPRLLRETKRDSVYHAIHMYIEGYQEHRPVMYLNKCKFTKINKKKWTNEKFVSLPTINNKELRCHLDKIGVSMYFNVGVCVFYRPGGKDQNDNIRRMIVSRSQIKIDNFVVEISLTSPDYSATDAFRCADQLKHAMKSDLKNGTGNNVII